MIIVLVFIVIGETVDFVFTLFILLKLFLVLLLCNQINHVRGSAPLPTWPSVPGARVANNAPVGSPIYRYILFNLYASLYISIWLFLGLPNRLY